MKSFSNTPPTTERQSLTRTVQIGWEHTIDGDELVFTLDDDGNPIPRTYTIPTRVTTGDLFEKAKTLDETALGYLAVGGWPAAVELVGLAVGKETVEAIAGDLSVAHGEFISFVEWVADELRLTDLLGGDGPGNAPGPSQGP